MKKLLVLSIVLGTFAFSTTLLAQIGYYAEQGETSEGLPAFSVDLPVLEGTKSLSEFYDYDNAVYASSDTGLEVAELSQFFLYRDTDDGSLGLVIIHDKPSDPNGGAVTFTIGPKTEEETGLPDTATLAVSDDPGEFTVSAPSAKGVWGWATCCTDGGAIGGLEDTEFSFWIDVSRPFSGITKWAARVGMGSDELVELPSLSEPVKIVAAPDGDGDGIVDERDNCPSDENTNQSDLDQDGAGDVCDCAPEDPNQSNFCAPCAAQMTGGVSFGSFLLLPTLLLPLLLRRSRSEEGSARRR